MLSVTKIFEMVAIGGQADFVKNYFRNDMLFGLDKSKNASGKWEINQCPIFLTYCAKERVYAKV